MTLPFADWLPQQRWYAGRARTLVSAEPAVVTPLADDLDHVLLVASYADGEVEHYQVFVGWNPEPTDEFASLAVIGADADRTGYDALFDEVAVQHLLRMIATGADRGQLRFRPEPGAELPLDRPARVVEAEQSNTSVILERDAILKAFRLLHPGINPDLELNRALGRAGCAHVARLLGAIEGTDEHGEPVALAMVTEFAENASEGWAMAVASARDLYAELDLRADEVGGDLAAESYRLGEAVAAVHRALAETMGTGTAPPPVAAMRARLDAAVADTHTQRHPS